MNIVWGLVGVLVKEGMNVLGVTDDRKFEVHCRAGDAGELRVGCESVLVTIGQRVLRDGAEEMWDSVMIHGDKAADGSFEIRVMVSNPDWHEPLQIASLRSRPGDGDCQTALGCNLDHIPP